MPVLNVLINVRHVRIHVISVPMPVKHVKILVINVQMLVRDVKILVIVNLVKLVNHVKLVNVVIATVADMEIVAVVAIKNNKRKEVNLKWHILTLH